MATREVKVTVYKVVRARSSAEGNPAFAFLTDKGRFLTAADTAQGYEVENQFETGTTLDVEVTLLLTRGRVFDWRKEAAQ